MCAWRAARLACAALVLALLARGCAGQPNAPNSSCDFLKHFRNDSLERAVHERGEKRCVRLYWGSDPARAAAALLRALLRAALGYRCIDLFNAPHRLADLQTDDMFQRTGNYKNLVVGISMAWEAADETLAWTPRDGKESGLAGWRLREFGRSPVPARCRLHARLSSAARDLVDCQSHSRWAFYTNTSTPALCDFVDDNGTLVLSVEGCDVATERLEARLKAAKLPLSPRPVSRDQLLSHLRSNNHSFLFLDFDIWADVANVTFVEPPPCVSVNRSCEQELDTAIGMRVADVDTLDIYAPELFLFIHDFKPSHRSLRMILEQTGNKNISIEEAACNWALDNTHDWNSTYISKFNTFYYWIAVYFCEDEPDYDKYKDIINKTGDAIFVKTHSSGYSIAIRIFRYNCSDADALSARILYRQQVKDLFGLLGVVAYGGAGAEQAALAALVLRAPLVLLDAALRVERTRALAAAGRAQHLALALTRFVRASGWRRLAVLSQANAISDHFYTLLDDTKQLDLGQFSIPLHHTDFDADKIIKQLRESNARIVFVNTDVEAALAILSAARTHGMGYENGYVWIVRDYRIVTHAARNDTYFTVSFWNRGSCGVPKKHKSLQKTLQQKYGDKCPPYTVALCDALLSLHNSFHQMFLLHPGYRLDLHTIEVLRLLNENFAKSPTEGLYRQLYYKEQSIEDTNVYVDQWHNGHNNQLAKWLVNNTAAHGEYQRGDLPRDDGETNCVLRRGDPFNPTCYDVAWITPLVLLALAPPALLLARSLLRRRLARLVQKREFERLARRQHVATVLASYLVKHDALELREELGAGRFGNVRLALLRESPRASRYVAAKALRDNAAASEESEFLREACTIASLNHKHIVRLVGVCIDGGPPLVLMELAFFGDLLGYLRARRPLVEGAGTELGEDAAECEEVAHVSDETLTRLAREAASALAYLSSRGVVHRDVRAANCLVDARRSLKLADFGMARETVASMDGAPEYACRRRGLFPVLWMAPESLAHGVFSSASDVWALGVLVLELVTMGARPYGSMSPLHVLEYVAAGGRPPLPPDATPQTSALARLCWARAAERRPSAAEVAAYLAERPRALRPALLPAREEPPDADSGFGESPSTELLPPDSPTDLLDQLDVFAVTH